MNAKQTKIVKTNEARHVCITPIARASFPVLFTPKSFKNDPDQKKEYKIDLIFERAYSDGEGKKLSTIKKSGKGKKGATPSLYQAYYNAAMDQWGPDKAKWPKFRYDFDDVFKDGNEIKNAEGDTYDGYEGKIVVCAKTGEKYPPKVFDRYGAPLAENDMYGGCYVQARLIARPYDYAGNRGVSFKLSQVIKIKDGERFGGGGNHEIAFSVEEEAGDNFQDGNETSSEGSEEDDSW